MWRKKKTAFLVPILAQDQRWWKTLEIGGHMTTTMQQLVGRFRDYFWTKICYYSDKNIFAALVYTALGSLG